MKIAMVLEIPTPYRDPLLDRIADLDDIDLHVLYCAPTEPLRNWSAVAGTTSSEVLPGLRLGGYRGGVNWKVNPQVGSRLSSIDPDVVVVGGYAHPTMQMAMMWAKRHRIPYVIVSETTDLSPRRPWRAALKAPIVRASVRNAAAFLPTGSHAKDYLIRWGGEPSRMFLFPNAPDVEGIQRDVSALRSRRGELEVGFGVTGSPLVLYVGRLIVQKNVEVLVRAMRRVQEVLPGMGLLIAGDGPLRAELEMLTRQLGLSHVIFSGTLSSAAVVRAYAISDIFVLSSAAETWGVVAQEAMAAGLPVVVSDRVGCARDLVDEGVNGYRFRHDDDSELAAHLLALSDETVRREMGAAGARIAREWGYGRCEQSFQSAMRLVDGG